MKRLSFILFASFCLTHCLYSQYTLEIEITGIKSNKGKIMLQLFDSSQKVIGERMSDITSNKCNLEIKNLPPGKYAVRYYHDENMDGKMQTNLVGKPTEGYGFSNNVTGKFGPPPFEKWLFNVSSDTKIVLNPT
jgi:uncharacterized protein (DUF2141 family)